MNQNRRVGSTARTLRASDGTDLWVAADDGDGPPVVLLHGLACNGTMWDPVRARLAAERRVVVVDLRGHGNSQPVQGGFSLTQQADDIRVVLEKLDLRDVTLVGHSGGGYAALAFASQFPEIARLRLRGIVTIGTSGSLTSLRERAVLGFSASRAFYLLFGFAPLGRLLVRTGAFGESPPPVLVEATRTMALACPRSTKAAWVRAITGTSQESAVRDLRVPLIAATGSRDAAVPKRRAETLASLAPDGQSVILEGLGHMAPIEDPAATAALIMNGFPP